MRVEATSMVGEFVVTVTARTQVLNNVWEAAIINRSVLLANAAYCKRCCFCLSEDIQKLGGYKSETQIFSNAHGK